MRPSSTTCLPSGERCRLSRQRVEADLSRRVLPREKILATVVRLMKLSLARVSNPEYAKQNNSLGLTTLRDDHVRLENGRIVWDFRGDARLARILKNCHHLPGSELFKYSTRQARSDTVGGRQSLSA